MCFRRSLVDTNEHLLREMEENRQRHLHEVKQLHWSYDQLKRSVNESPLNGGSWSPPLCPHSRLPIDLPKTSTHASPPPQLIDPSIVTPTFLPPSPPRPTVPSSRLLIRPSLLSPLEPPNLPTIPWPSIPPPKVLSTVLCNNQLVLGRCIVQTSLYGSLKLCYYLLISQLETDAISSQSQISQPLAAVGFT